MTRPDPPFDWTAALDDLLCMRLTHCTLCTATPLVYLGIEAFETACGWRAASYAFCKRCHEAWPGNEAALIARLCRNHGWQWVAGCRTTTDVTPGAS